MSESNDGIISESNDGIITEEEKELLQEVMNISFGKAAADLAEVIDIYVILSVPNIKILQAVNLPEFLKSEIRDVEDISIIEQKFWGKFKGDALLIFPSGSALELINILEPQKDTFYGSEPIDVLERETLMEVGNILIGACVGKIAELLKDIVTYTPPRVIIEKYPLDKISKEQFSNNDTVIVLKTVFQFKERDVNGFLFLMTSNDSVDWLKKALYKFMEQYE